MKLLRDMTEPELREFFTTIARDIEERLPPGPARGGKKCMFALIVADSVEHGAGQYVSNIVREDCIKLLRETADRIASREDIPR
jgi:hypothetical protein